MKQNEVMRRDAQMKFDEEEKHIKDQLMAKKAHLR